MQEVLPYTNEEGYYEFRLESIGGLGANLCGKMLGELGALYLSLNASSFSSYGSEKRGSPVKSYIRWCNDSKTIRVNSPVVSPHILCIFHEGLLGTHPVEKGIVQNTKIILNTALSPREACEKWNFAPGTLYCIDALKAAMECHSRINMVLLGSIAKVAGFIPLSAVETLCEETLGKKYPALIKSNLEGIKMGYSMLSEGFISDSSNHEKMQDVDDNSKSNVTWGYDNAPIGGVNPRIGSSVISDLAPSREGYIPLFIKEKCINCGLCDSTCPDMVFQFEKGIYMGKECMVNKGLDYHHCKGCLRCVEICPTNALVKALEKDYPNKPWFMPNKYLITDSVPYMESGPSSYITSDSYLDEQRVDGGVV
ncbi:MAG TPA: 2-oxoacid:acceptor oxidoreductase family protein [Lachnospiraceae bacterium]|nr:2-oxoacid:acceptor oxidoreductase family protein [Lachnospiraceae bacterium]